MQTGSAAGSQCPVLLHVVLHVYYRNYPFTFCKVVVLQEFTPLTFRSVPCRTTCSAACRTTGTATPFTFRSVLRSITCGTTFGATGTAAPSTFCSVSCSSLNKELLQLLYMQSHVEYGTAHPSCFVVVPVMPHAILHVVLKELRHVSSCSRSCSTCSATCMQELLHPSRFVVFPVILHVGLHVVKQEPRHPPLACHT